MPYINYETLILILHIYKHFSMKGCTIIMLHFFQQVYANNTISLYMKLKLMNPNCHEYCTYIQNIKMKSLILPPAALLNYLPIILILPVLAASSLIHSFNCELLITNLYTHITLFHFICMNTLLEG